MSDQSNKISASPKVRKFARELGVDINNVKGTERLGRVVEKDLKDFVSSRINHPQNHLAFQDESNFHSWL